LFAGNQVIEGKIEQMFVVWCIEERVWGYALYELRCVVLELETFMVHLPNGVFYMQCPETLVVISTERRWYQECDSRAIHSRSLPAYVMAK
jgi:hypothetical protein